MKRIFLAFVYLVVALAGKSQSGSVVADSLWWADQKKVSLDVGLSAGTSLYLSTFDDSPYYSKYGLTLQLPVMFNYRVSPHWRLGTGLRLDFNWNPLRYNVEVNRNHDIVTTNGIDFASTPTTDNQNAYSYYNYIGIPLQATWYPWPTEPRLLGITLDLFGGYAMNKLIRVNYSSIDRTDHPYGIETQYGEWSEHTLKDDPTLLPWKLELGVTLTTDVLGLLHGVRLFFNMLPTYHDPVTDEGIHLGGITLFL